MADSWEVFAAQESNPVSPGSSPSASRNPIQKRSGAMVLWLSKGRAEPGGEVIGRAAACGQTEGGRLDDGERHHGLALGGQPGRSISSRR